MTKRLARAAAAITQHWKRSLLVAILAIAALGAAAGTASPPPDDFEVPGADSQEAIDLFRDHSKQFAGADAQLVYTVEDGRITDAGPKQAVRDALAEVADLKGVAEVPDPFGPEGQIAQEGPLAGKLAAVQVRYTTEFQDIEKEDGEALLKAGEPAEGSGVQVEMRGAPIDLARFSS